jgi:hypothetical protein
MLNTASTMIVGSTAGPVSAPQCLLPVQACIPLPEAVHPPEQFPELYACPSRSKLPAEDGRPVLREPSLLAD